MSRVVMVVIGRNEGERLRRCLSSVLPHAPCVYVDSCSKDGSSDLARSMGAEVVDLDPARPLSAARGRNEGAARALSLYPSAEMLQFLDGDCEMQPAWLGSAIKALESRPDVAVVCGRRRERYPELSVYNRLMDLEWDTPAGEVASCGGDALFRRTDFEMAGGFDQLCLAGEEPELCARLRSKGRRVLRIDVEMTLHDADLRSFGAWWKRQDRSGYGGMDSDRRQVERGGEPFFGKQVRSAWVWGAAYPLLLVAGAAGLWVWSPFAAVIWAGVLIGLLGVQVLRVAAGYHRRGLGRIDAILGGLLTMISKVPQAKGQVRWLRDRRAGRSGRLIEYKTVVSPGRG